MASAAEQVNVRMSWSGVYSYPGKWQLDHVLMNINGLSQRIIAKLHPSLPPNQEQPLTFKVTERSAASAGEEVDALTLAPGLLSDMTLSVVMYQTYQDRSRGTLRSNGSIEYQSRARKDSLPVTLHALPELKDGDNLLIQLSYPQEQAGVRANFVLQTEEEVKAQHVKYQQDQLRETGLDMILQGTRTLAHLAAGDKLPHMEEDISAALMGLQGLGRAATASSHSTLDSLTIPELQQQFDAAKVKLEQERANFTRACASGDQSLIMAALANKQKAMASCGELAAALQRKGVQVEAEAPQIQCAQS